MKRVKEVIIQLSMLSLPIILTAGGIYSFSLLGESDTADITNKEIISTEPILNTNKQLVTVRVDSLLSIIPQEEQPYFTVSNNSTALEFTCLSGQEKKLNQLFFNGNSDFRAVTGSNLKFKDSPYGFEIPKEKIGDAYYVNVPAELIQSLLINK